ncbi:uncharacterized protein PV06_00461 [Exophiala oligosperma]|uniref:Uncharacterized protein n=1 Tax=Exophiala oligosperma TaxID=215243 RepID=A0A0D2EIN0_9EURO|nr:uncharacterized protein PV06_00461 [Exophiala oligosperma]KIW47799.1 hypothetical protein PV06_00461 [Exophiala oligosperma]
MNDPKRRAWVDSPGWTKSSYGNTHRTNSPEKRPNLARVCLYLETSLRSFVILVFSFHPVRLILESRSFLLRSVDKGPTSNHQSIIKLPLTCFPETPLGLARHSKDQQDSVPHITEIQVHIQQLLGQPVTHLHMYCTEINFGLMALSSRSCTKHYRREYELTALYLDPVDTRFLTILSLYDEQYATRLVWVASSTLLNPRPDPTFWGKNKTRS